MNNIFTCTHISSSLFSLSTNQIIELLSDSSDLPCYLNKIMENICNLCYKKTLPHFEEKKMKNVYSCSCIADTLTAITSSQIKEMFRLQYDLNCKYVEIEKENDYYIICAESVEFCYIYNNYFETCADSKIMCISCFDVLKYGFRRICSMCELGLQKYLYRNLVKIKYKDG